MSLKEYARKRNFNTTNEPKPNIKNTKYLRFVIQHHMARKEHYDFRLEYNGVLLSWAVPKGLSLNPNIKRLAVHVEDHPIDYINFEGIIEKGNYGAGTVEIYDKGFYVPFEDFSAGLKKGHIKFILNGEKIKGAWSLIKTDEKNWLIIKNEDEYAMKNELKNTNLPFNSCQVQLASHSKKMPTSNDWIYEIKYDGYRMLAFIENKKIKIISRNGIDFSKKLKKLCKKLQNLDKNCVLDGEIVFFDDKGRSDFSKLQNALKNDKDNEICFVVFDLLALNNDDLRNNPLIERKKKLQILLYNLDKQIIYSAHVDDGISAIKFAQQNNLEGIIAKKEDSLYIGKRTEDWLKFKCYNRQEFVVCGYIKNKDNDAIRSLILGYYDESKLCYIGKVGTGFTYSQRRELYSLFASKIIDKCPFEDVKFKEKIFWIKQQYVAEIQYAEITKDNVLRQPSFIGLRNDKKAKEVKLENTDYV